MFNLKSVTWTTVDNDYLYWFVLKCRRVRSTRIESLQSLSNYIYMHKVCYERL